MSWKWPKLTLKDEPGPMQNVEFRRQKQFNWDALRGWALGLFKSFTDYSDSLDAKMSDFDKRFDDQMSAATDGDKDLSEVVDARRPDGGNAYDTIGDRMDAMDKVSEGLTADESKFDGSIGGMLMNYFDDESDEIGGLIPNYYKEQLDGFATIPTANLNIGWITDVHLQQDSYAPNSLAHYAYMGAASRRARLDAIIAGGDNINGWYAKDELLFDTTQSVGTLFGRSADGTDVFCMFGNHDTGYGQNNNVLATDALTEAQIKKLYETSSLLYGEVRNGDSLYGYKDYTDKKVRVIWLDAFDLPTNVNSDGTYAYNYLTQSCFGNVQLNWLASKALALPDGTWQVMIFSHAPLKGTFGAQKGNTDVEQYNTDALVGILNAFQLGKSFSITTQDAVPATIDCDFSKQGAGVLIAFVSGHIHQDGQMTYAGINCIETACSLCNSAVNPSRIADTESEDCWDIFSVDPVARTIHAYRFGYGSDRDFTY